MDRDDVTTMFDKEIIDNDSFRYWLKADIGNIYVGIKFFVDPVGDPMSKMTEEDLWQKLEKNKHHFVTVEEYMAETQLYKSKKTSITAPDILETIKKLNQLAIEGNAAIEAKNLPELKRVLKAYREALK